MTKMKSLRKALITSAVSMVLCSSMFVGTTYAWFTDSVTSNGNVIQTGTLNVAMYWAEGDEAVPTTEGWTDASEGAIFNNTKWEPGYAEAKHVKVVNEGTLALKYKLMITPNGEVSKLADVIDVYFLKEAKQVTREALASATPVGTLAEMIADPDGAAYGYLLPEGATATEGTLEVVGSQTVTIALKMRENAGNEYQGLSIGSDFTIQLLATQYNYESDSFGSEYDENANFADEIATVEDFKLALENGGKYKLIGDIASDEGVSLKIAEGVSTELNLNGYTITNPVVGAPAIVNNGSLKISGEGNIVNGTNNTKASHTIQNFGTLVIDGGHIGTDDTAGAAIVNNGTATINGGTCASKQENAKSDGLCAYAFINNTGTMTINDATLNGQTHGLFGAYAGKIIVNGGNYTMDGNDGLGCYVVYATGDAEVRLVGGTVSTNNPRSNRVFFVSNNGNYFNADAVATENITYIGTTIYLNDVEQTYTDDGVQKVSDFEDLGAALTEGGFVVLSEDMEVTSNLDVKGDSVIYGQDETLTFKDNTKITVAADCSLEIVGATLDAEGEFSFDETGSIVYDVDARRTTPLLNAGAGSVLTLGEGTVVENVVAKGSAVVSAKGTDDNRAKLILDGATIQNCAGESGTIINVEHASDVVIEDGTMISGNASYNNNNHGIIRVYNAWDAANPSTVTMNGGEISGNYYSGNGLVGLYYGKLIMNGGRICDNAWFEDNQKHNGFYPVVYVHSNSQFVMNDGEISGNSVRFGVLNCLNSAVEPAIIINGGTVINNTNTDNNTEAFVAVVIEDEGKIYKSVSVSADATVSGMVWDYYTGYYTLDEYFAKVK